MLVLLLLLLLLYYCYYQYYRLLRPQQLLPPPAAPPRPLLTLAPVIRGHEKTVTTAQAQTWSNHSQPAWAAWASIPYNPLKRPFIGLILGILGPNSPSWKKPRFAKMKV